MLCCRRQNNENCQVHFVQIYSNWTISQGLGTKIAFFLIKKVKLILEMTIWFWREILHNFDEGGGGGLG